MRTKLGLILNSQFLTSEDPVQRSEDLVEQTRCARDAGLDSVWVIQHFLATPFQMLQQWPLLGRLVGESGDMTIGTSIFELTLSNPVYAAEQAATMDVLSGGRFVFGVGLGFRDEEFLAFGVDPRKKVSRFEECLEVAMRLWTEDSVTHEGAHFALQDAQLLLKPVQKPYPPVWVAGSGDPAVRRAARYGLPWLINPHATLQTVERQMDLHREELTKAGQPTPEDVPLFREMAIAATREEAIALSRPHLERKYSAYADWGLDKPMPEEENLSAPFDELAADRFIIGSPDDCLEDIQRYVDRIGATHFLMRVDWPGTPQQVVLDQIELIGEKIMPALPELPGTGSV